MRENRAKVAVIGTGIAGLTAARELDRTHAVTLYEADRRVGGHTNTIRVDDPRGERWVDTGFIVHNDRNYPHFTAAARRARGGDPGGGDGDVDRHGRRPVRVREHPARAVRAALEPAAAALLGPDPRPASLQPRGSAAGGSARHAQRRRVPARFGLLALVSRARDRPRGLSGLVRRPGRRSGEFPLGFLAEFLENHGQLQLTRRPQLADDPRRLARVRRTAARAVRRPGAAPGHR